MIDEKKLWEQHPEYLNEQQKMELQNKKGGYNKGWNDCLDIFLDIIQAQPKVNEWIPIEERLPELAGYRCLATIENKYGQRKVADVFTNYGMYGVSPFWLSNAKEIDLSVWKVIAWQPLPNPYVKE